jgi:hypothetical protein
VCTGSQVLCGGQCTALATDASNCGACAHVCPAGFACSAGFCATTLSSLPAFGLGVNSTGVYFSSHQGVSFVGLSGGAVSTLVQDPTAGIQAVDAANYYWTNQFAGAWYLRQTAVAGGSAIQLAGPAGSPARAVVDATTVYSAQGGTLSTVRIGGGGATTLETASELIGPMTLDSSNVYWGTSQGNGGVTVVAKATAASILSATSGYHPNALAVDATNLYWGDPNDLLLSTPLAGGTAKALVTIGPNMFQIGSAQAVLVDGATLYFATDDTVASVSTGGGPETILLTVPGINGLAMDATNLYVASGTAGVVKVPK